jgi:signal transduction histidine kinase
MPNGGEILIRSERAKVDHDFCQQHSKARPGDYIKILVADTDKGVQEDMQPKIFNPFFTNMDIGGGTGLGLAVVYGIIKNHKGFIIIESKAGKGTKFSAYLPVAPKIEKKETASEKA